MFPETANNSYVTAALIPLLTLGLPTSPTIAVLMGAFMINGLTPGPLLFRDNPAFVWTVIASLLVGNTILLILNLPLIRLWVQALKVPYTILMVMIFVFSIVGSFSLSGSVFDVGVMVAFGVLGYHAPYWTAAILMAGATVLAVNIMIKYRRDVSPAPGGPAEYGAR